jgi:glycosyltransferase involved in cell wall biosynthesis
MNVFIWYPKEGSIGGLNFIRSLVGELSRDQDVGMIRICVNKGVADHVKGDYSLAEKISVRVMKDDSRLLAICRRIRRRVSRSRLGRLLGLRREEPPLKVVDIRKYEADCDLCFVPWPCRTAVVRTRLPLAVLFQDAIELDWPELKGHELWKQYKEECRRWFRLADRIVVSSRYVSDRLLAHFPWAEPKLVRIEHRASPLYKQSAASPSERLLGVLPSQYLIFPSNLGQHKNHRTLLIAYARIARRRECPLVLVGPSIEQIGYGMDGDARISIDAMRIRGLIDRLRLELGKDVICLGYLSGGELRYAIENAFALIMPTLDEGGGSYPVEEALTLGTPVCCSDIPVLREHVDGRGATVAWFDPYSPESIAAAIESMMDEYPRYKEAAAAGKDDNPITWPSIAENYARLFGTLTKLEL